MSPIERDVRDTIHRTKINVDAVTFPPVPVPCGGTFCKWPLEECELDDLNRGAVDADDFVNVPNCSRYYMSRLRDAADSGKQRAETLRNAPAVIRAKRVERMLAALAAEQGRKASDEQREMIERVVDEMPPVSTMDEDDLEEERDDD